jgi:hypothetical protein
VPAESANLLDVQRDEVESCAVEVALVVADRLEAVRSDADVRGVVLTLEAPAFPSWAGDRSALALLLDVLLAASVGQTQSGRHVRARVSEESGAPQVELGFALAPAGAAWRGRPPLLPEVTDELAAALPASVSAGSDFLGRATLRLRLA